jgi:hypothetical protein
MMRCPLRRRRLLLSVASSCVRSQSFVPSVFYHDAHLVRSTRRLRSAQAPTCWSVRDARTGAFWNVGQRPSVLSRAEQADTECRTFYHGMVFALSA